MRTLRLFVALNLSDEMKELLDRDLQPIREILPYPVRFLKPHNWHLTVTFLGEQDADSASRIAECVRKTASALSAPVLDFVRLGYGPHETGKESRVARMIWLDGSAETSKEVGKLKEILEANLIASGVRFREETRRFQAHVTLARFDPIARRDLPDIDKDCRYECASETLDLMISHLARSGADYEVAGRFAFRSKETYN